MRSERGAAMGAESERVAGFGKLEDGLRQAGDWYRWGPYVSERQWGTVREDYSASGDAWDYLPHDHARSRAYRWGEDGLAGFCDVEQRLCLGLALWNGRDPILKERAFGLTGSQGNHGEDVKEYWWYLDAIPSHAWNRWRYHYPQAAYPYQDLIDQNAWRNRYQPEYELVDTGVFEGNRYWIVEVHYAKADPDDLFRGLDNPAYYRLAEDPRYYVDTTGCGNSLNVGDPVTLALIMDSLRYWLTEMHVDGFRFDLAPALARQEGEFQARSAFFDLVAQDPVVSRAKLVAEPWDVGQMDSYDLGRFPPVWRGRRGRAGAGTPGGTWGAAPGAVSGSSRAGSAGPRTCTAGRGGARPRRST